MEEVGESAAEGEVYAGAGQGGDEEDGFRFDWEDDEEVEEVEGSGELILENPDDDEEEDDEGGRELLAALNG